MGGAAYQAEDGSLYYTSCLQSSGSDDDLTFLVPLVLFGAFTALISWWPPKLRRVKYAVFSFFWLIQLPNWSMEVGTMSATVDAAGNWWAAVLVAVYCASPVVVAAAIISSRLRKRRETQEKQTACKSCSS